MADSSLSRGEPSHPVFDSNYTNLLREIKAEGRLLGLTEEVWGQSWRGGLHNLTKFDTLEPASTRKEIQRGYDGHLRKVSLDTNAGLVWQRCGRHTQRRWWRTSNRPNLVSRTHCGNTILLRSQCPVRSVKNDLNCLPGGLHASGGVAVPGYLCHSVRQLDGQKLDPSRRAAKININICRSGKVVACVLSPPVFASQVSTRSLSLHICSNRPGETRFFGRTSRPFKIWRHGALDLSPAASEHLEYLPFFSSCFKVVFWSVDEIRVSMEVARESLCRYGEVDVIFSMFTGCPGCTLQSATFVRLQEGAISSDPVGSCVISLLSSVTI